MGTIIKSAQIIDQLIERRYLVRLEFQEQLLGSRPTQSIAAKWLEQQDRANAARDMKRQSSAGKVLEAAPDLAAYREALEYRIRFDADAAGSSDGADLEGRSIDYLEDLYLVYRSVTELDELKASHGIGLAGAMVAETNAHAGEDRLAVTGFSADAETGRLHLWDFQIMGYLKAAAAALDMKIPGKRADAISAKTQIQALTWVFGADSSNALDRRIYLRRDDAYLTEPDGLFDRPLRAMTPQGERVSIAVSEYLAPPVSATAQIVVLRGCRLKDEQFAELLTFGMFQGLGQWRSGGWGRFIATLERVD